MDGVKDLFYLNIQVRELGALEFADDDWCMQES